MRRNVAVDIATDQTPAHDPLSYVPAGMTLAEASELRNAGPEEYVKQARASMAAHCAALVELLDRGAEVFDYGNSLRAEARLGGFERAFDYPGFIPAYIRPLFCEGKGPFRWAALSGDPADIAATDAAVQELFPDNDRLHRWLSLAGQKVRLQGLPARICWLGYGERDQAGLALQRNGGRRAPESADSDRPRPPRLWLGGFPVPGDGADARRVRRHRRLAAAECTVEHGQRGVVGVHPPWRRRRDRPFHTCRAGQCG